MIRTWTAMTAMCVLVLTGCAARPKPVVADDGLRGAGAHSSALIRNGGAIAALKPDPNPVRHAIPIVIALDVYHLTVPWGAVSDNDDFWKRVDEQKLDVATYDLLLKNGIRVGVGHDPDWPWFRGLLGRYPSSRSIRGRTQPGKEGYIELEARKNVVYQTLFWLDDHGNAVGRTFERCDDLLGISYVASPHHPGDTVLKVCPIVRGLQRFFPVTILNNEEAELEMTRPEHLYNLRLEANVPMDDFLIVAPSKQARWPTSLGSTFLTTDGKSELLEDVYILVPRTFRTDDPRARENPLP